MKNASLIGIALSRATVASEDRRYLASLVEQYDNLPRIESEDQYEEYRLIQKGIREELSEAGLAPGTKEFLRSTGGILDTVVGTRIIEWRKAHDRAPSDV